MSLFFKIWNLAKQKAYPLCPSLYTRLQKRKRLIKFIVSGCMAGGVDLLLLFVLHGILHVEVVVATSLAFIISFWISFYLQKFWTFDNHHRQDFLRQMLLYFSMAFINLNINGVLMHLLVNKYHFWYLGAQVLVSGLIGVESFTLNKFFIFKKRPENIL